MTFISRTALRVRRAFLRPVAGMTALFHQFFAARPASKRVLLVLLLFGVPTLTAHLLLPTLAPLVTAQLAMLLLGTFLGMGAERASTDWDDFLRCHPCLPSLFGTGTPLNVSGLLLPPCALSPCG